MTRSLCQEVTKNWHSIPSNRTTACSGSNVSVDLGIVSLTLGNSSFPFADSFIADSNQLGELPLGQTLLLAQPRHKGAKPRVINSLFHPQNLLAVCPQFTPPGCFWQPTGGRMAEERGILLGIRSWELRWIACLPARSKMLPQIFCGSCGGTLGRKLHFRVYLV